MRLIFLNWGNFTNFNRENPRIFFMPPYLDPNAVRYSQIINQSYHLFFNQYLVQTKAGALELSRLLYLAPFVVLAHDGKPDPVFIYANQRAQDLWGYSWEEFLKLPSRLSAASDQQQDRSRFLAEVAEYGYSSEYSGIRVDKNGRSFRIENVALWNLKDEKIGLKGQAACFSNWAYL